MMQITAKLKFRKQKNCGKMEYLLSQLRWAQGLRWHGFFGQCSWKIAWSLFLFFFQCFWIKRNNNYIKSNKKAITLYWSFGIFLYFKTLKEEQRQWSSNLPRTLSKKTFHLSQWAHLNWLSKCNNSILPHFFFFIFLIWAWLWPASHSERLAVVETYFLQDCSSDEEEIRNGIENKILLAYCACIDI